MMRSLICLWCNYGLGEDMNGVWIYHVCEYMFAVLMDMDIRPMFSLICTIHYYNIGVLCINFIISMSLNY